jgi:hypothetical protein
MFKKGIEWGIDGDKRGYIGIAIPSVSSFFSIQNFLFEIMFLKNFHASISLYQTFVNIPTLISRRSVFLSSGTGILTKV